MQTYYELGYYSALQKLGMASKYAGARELISAVKGGLQSAKSVVSGKGLRLLDPEVEAAKAQALQKARVQSRIDKDLAKKRKELSRPAPTPEAEVAGTTVNPGKGQKLTREKAPVVESAMKPEAVAQPAPPPLPSQVATGPSATPAAGATGAAAGGEAAAKTEEPGLLRKYWLPASIGAGLLGLGGYAYLRSRDPMGPTGQLPSTYGY